MSEGKNPPNGGSSVKNYIEQICKTCNKTFFNIIRFDDCQHCICKKASRSHDSVNAPQHYTHGGIETIDYLKAKMTQDQFEGFLIGNVLKYVSRYPHKNGLEDLKKARWYLNKLIGE